MSGNLFDGIAQTIESAPDRPCLIHADGTVWSYGEIEAKSARLANLLIERGVTPGDRIAVQVEKSALNVVLYLACLRVGAVYLPLNTAYTDRELAYFFGDAEPRLIVCAPARLEAIRSLSVAADVPIDTLDADSGGSLADDASAMPASFGTIGRNADDLAAILYTSGTTGRSKGAMITHGNLRANGMTLIDAWGISAADVLLHALPIYHVHGLFVGLNTCLLSGAGMVFLPTFNAEQVIAHLPTSTMMMGVPTFYTRLLAKEAFDHKAAAGIRLFIAGSAPLLDETFHAFEARTGQRILERYGMTETGMLCSNPLAGARRPGTVGPSLSDVELRVRDGNGKIAGVDCKGVIEVRGPNVFKGYWRMADKTAEAFTEDGFFITGDIGVLDRDGYVAIVGRDKDMIITGGYNVYPKEVEQVLDRLPGIGESAVIGVPHLDFGEGVIAVVTTTGDAPIDETAAIAAARAELAAYKVPKAIIPVSELPRNSMGKVQKKALRERYNGRFLS